MAPIPRNRRVRRELPAPGWKVPEKPWLCPECEKRMEERINGIAYGMAIAGILFLLAGLMIILAH